MRINRLALILTATILITGCAKAVAPAGKSSHLRSKINFHSRDMIVPDFNGGRPIRCPEVNTNS